MSSVLLVELQSDRNDVQNDPSVKQCRNKSNP